MALTLPASMALLVLAQPIIAVLFERGSFSPQDTAASAAALSAFAVGLPAFVLVKVFSPGFFAREDTRTPMWFAGVAVAANVVLSLALFPFFAHVGIAIATSAAGWINAGLLVGTLMMRGQFNADDALRRRLPLLLLAAVLMGACIWLAAALVAPALRDPALALRAPAVAGLVTGGLVVFLAFCQLTGAADFLQAVRTVRRRG